MPLWSLRFLINQWLCVPTALSNSLSSRKRMQAESFKAKSVLYSRADIQSNFLRLLRVKTRSHKEFLDKFQCFWIAKKLFSNTKIAGFDASEESLPVDFLQQKARSGICSKCASASGMEFNLKNSYQSSQARFSVQTIHCTNQQFEMQRMWLNFHSLHRVWLWYEPFF